MDNIIDAIVGCSELSELSELSSDDELNDDWSPPDDDNTISEQSDCDDIVDESTLSDDEPLASIASKKSDPKKYKFDKRRKFIPPSNLDFDNIIL